MRKYVLGALFLAACGGSIEPANGAYDASRDAVNPDDAEAGTADAGRDAGRDGGRRDASVEEPDASPGEVDSGDPGVEEDGGSSTTPDAALPQGDTVPVFVAMGYGGYRIISCDYGLTWVNDQQEAANGGDDGNLVRGVGAGNGRFVAAVGGGGVRKLWVSEDGVNWTKMQRDGNGYSDVAYGIGKFVAGGGHQSIVSSDGVSWGSEGTMGSGGILRNLAFGNYNGGRFVAVGDKGRRMSSADGITWGSQVEEGADLHGLDFGAGVFVATTDGSATRYSEDGGATWKNGNVNGAGNVRGILYDGKRFLVTTSSNTFTSTDGKSWQSHSANGGPSGFAVSDDGKHYAGANWQDILHSTDGLTWQKVKSAKQGITRVRFQRVKPSAVCPK